MKITLRPIASFSLMVLGIFLVFLSGPSSTEESSSMDAVIKSLYESLSFPEGGAPDFERLRSAVTPEAQFIRINKDDTIDRMSRETFIRSFQERIQKGLMKTFHESEIARRVEVFGRMAHVFSTYQKGINITDPEKMVRGINSIQLIHAEGLWQICAILWMDERSDCPIPLEYLPHSSKTR
jgi:hypothetical protein